MWPEGDALRDPRPLKKLHDLPIHTTEIWRMCVGIDLKGVGIDRREYNVESTWIYWLRFKKWVFQIQCVRQKGWGEFSQFISSVDWNMEPKLILTKWGWSARTSSVYCKEVVLRLRDIGMLEWIYHAKLTFLSLHSGHVRVQKTFPSPKAMRNKFWEGLQHLSRAVLTFLCRLQIMMETATVSRNGTPTFIGDNRTPGIQGLTGSI